MYLASRLCLFTGYCQCQAHKQMPDTICSIKQTAFSYTHTDTQTYAVRKRDWDTDKT